jgi:hypothetical protein
MFWGKSKYRGGNSPVRPATNRSAAGSDALFGWKFLKIIPEKTCLLLIFEHNVLTYV